MQRLHTFAKEAKYVNWNKLRKTSKTNKLTTDAFIWLIDINFDETQRQLELHELLAKLVLLVCCSSFACASAWTSAWSSAWSSLDCWSLWFWLEFLHLFSLCLIDFRKVIITIEEWCSSVLLFDLRLGMVKSMLKRVSSLETSAKVSSIFSVHLLLLVSSQNSCWYFISNRSW